MRKSHIKNYFNYFIIFLLLWGHMLKIHQLICSFSLCHFISWSFLLFGMDKNLHLDLGQLDKFYMGLSLETINCFLL